MDKALIITPTGCPMFFDGAFDKDDHWRFSKPNRSFEVCVIGFKQDYVPESGSFDHFFHYPVRHKWKQLPELCEFLIVNGIDWRDYDYIGYWDDDYCTDIRSIEVALSIARQMDMRLLQQSLISQTGYRCLIHNPEWLFSETNFTEMGVPFYRMDIFKKILKLLKDYVYNESEWGIDKIMCDYLGQTAHVIHASKIKHMRQESWYDKSNAFREMDYLMRVWFPAYMKSRGREYTYRDSQDTLRAFIKKAGDND
jgi:hypothetical protein